MHASHACGRACKIPPQLGDWEPNVSELKVSAASETPEHRSHRQGPQLWRLSLHTLLDSSVSPRCSSASIQSRTFAQAPGSRRGSAAWCAATHSARGATAGLSACRGDSKGMSEVRVWGLAHRARTAVQTSSRAAQSARAQTAARSAW